jgi:hypothetical protein
MHLNLEFKLPKKSSILDYIHTKNKISKCT